MIFKDLFEFDTLLTADVVEWRPFSPNNKFITLACGTYYLEKESKNRVGNLHLIQFKNNQFELINNCSLSFNKSGILDLKWLNENKIITIDSNNELEIFEYDEFTNNLNMLNKIETKKDSLHQQQSIGLTLDFSELDNQNFNVLTSNNLGQLNLVHIENENFNLKTTFKGHELEVWSVHLDRNNSNIIYSGADDSYLKMWDLRTNSEKMKPVNECNLFDGGVCSIISPKRQNNTYLNGFSDNMILCSSYDEKIYVIDKRNMKKSLKQSQRLGGGVWKMKLHEYNDLLLTACMHHGVNLVNTDDLEISLFYDKHQKDTLAYGCDFLSRRIEDNKEHDIVASCSFYNHNLRVWKIIY